MKYAVTYDKSFRYLDIVDEILIAPYTGANVNLIDFFKEKDFKDTQRIILDLTTLDLNIITSLKMIIPMLVDIQKNFPLFTVKTSMYQQEDIKLLKENNIPFIFKEYAENFEKFYVQKELGAADIYITESLGFQLDKLQPFRDQVKLRVFPNIAQSAKGTTRLLPQLYKFFIRPEDIEIYEKYIDVLEIYPSKDRNSVLFEIYKKQQWIGSLSDIIMDLDIDINNDTISPYFAQHRVLCHQDCLLNRCTLCDQIYSLGKKFEEADIILYKPSKNIRELSDEEKEELIEDFKKQLKEKIENESKTDEEIMQLDEEESTQYSS